MIETRRQFRISSVKKRFGSFSGPFYWIPLPDGSWSPITFADHFYGEQADHVVVWLEVISILSLKWNLDEPTLQIHLNDAPYGLPRGRITKCGEQQFNLFHGDDIPDECSFDEIFQIYGLAGCQVTLMFDEHEQMLDEDAKTFWDCLTEMQTMH